jgi:hypothetical protein
MIHASKYGQAEEKIDIVLTEEEKVIEASIKVSCLCDTTVYHMVCSFHQSFCRPSGAVS